MAEERKTWPTGGRRLGWRASMLLGGLALFGYATALVLWPWILGWTAAAACGLLGLICAASALLARGE
jgi:hypothetical protein